LAFLLYGKTKSVIFDFLTNQWLEKEAPDLRARSSACVGDSHADRWAR